jgi:hypothetical protein
VRFWDTSALVPLLVGQARSGDAERWAAEDPDLALWTLTEVEVSSALHRLVRDGWLDDPSATTAQALADEFVRAGHLVTAVPEVKTRARRLLRLHDLRHTAASLLIAAGAPVTLVAARLGHASPSTTLNVHAHMLPGADESTNAALEAAWEAATTGR